MTLLEFQRRMMKAVMQPLASSDRIAQKMADGRHMRIEAAEFITPNSRLSSLERLEIYSRSYWYRTLDSLYDDFPGLRAVLGQQAFHRLSRAYLADCPSQSFTLRNLGARLAGWLQRNPQYAGKKLALALDMVRLEWAHIEAFDGAAEKVLGPEDLIELGPDFRAGLQPYIRLLEFEYPVDRLLIQVNQASEEHEEASNTVLKPKHHGLVQRVTRFKRERIYVAVHRMDFIVHYRRLAAEEYRLLNALREGQPFGRAIRTGFKGSPVASGEQPSMLEKWFAAWAELGWLCPPARAGKKEQGRISQ
jgi:hypothetical protein